MHEGEPIVVTEGGHPRAVLVPVREEDDVERLLMASNAELLQILADADRRISATGGVPHDEFWARVEGEAAP